MTANASRYVGGLALAWALSACSVPLVPLQHEEMQVAVQKSVERVAADQEPITGAISLYEAMARALKYDLDYRVELRTQALRLSEFDASRLDLLPQWVANAGYNARNNDAATTSLSLPSQTPSAGYSTSSERRSTLADMSLSWDILDFGLSYVRAQQKADEVLSAMEQRRKVANRIVEDVRTAYWRAVSAERLLSKMRELEGTVKTALDESRALEKKGTTSPLTALTFQRELIQIRAELQRLQRDLVVAKRQLGALMNLRPDQDFQLLLPPRQGVSVSFDLPLNDAINSALYHRPELREVRYRQRINRREMDATLLKNFPSLRMFLGVNHDTNRYLQEADWVSMGAKTSWNLINLFRYPEQKKAVTAQQQLLEERELALTMAVMTEVYVSRSRVSHLNGELQTAVERLDVQTRILDKIRAGFQAGSASRQTLIREEMNTLTEEVRYDIVFADLQNAQANTYAAMGMDTLGPEVTGQESVKDLAAALEQLWRSRENTSQGNRP